MTWKVGSKMRIALLDDHAVVRYGLAKRLAEEPDFSVIGAFATSKELMTALRAEPADLLLIDYSLGSNDIDGLNLIRALRVRFPRSKILVTSAHSSPATVVMAMKAGARGFVGKSQELSELILAIRAIHTGREYLSIAMSRELAALQAADPGARSEPEPAPPRRRRARNTPPSSDTLSDMPNLSPREREVLRCCLDGLSVTDIAEKFARSIKTISCQKQSAFRKLGVRSDNELFKIEYQIKDL
ncbi:LuxR family transcriptional regulator [Herbaspirillum rubrisubalbicans]|jgi:DNA-binding NarL/FixJ family response regulator|uniref:LuxR family transcriptional regulator n=2 Tax=Herbaspirillum rubrisubalbicans TaxID=80842 RepID=A0ABX9C3W1_9BURK|nr:response regulator [Herbaspirillum rubrisubalbicans]MCP1573514.1 DNA-binding NarL/FixJ family response regulator [Herbaspirillum rubrisubalbicans]NQE47804.1 LuxR family transcriptional regulator [Herbaspirillum rubrisubalbicans]RAM65033.1 LuxR family transcriptional regulator [Herbaspirillum rubrisubalbicans]RAN47767.1 LuxR family transcriptional regulator [Herbaspirillum rubrisubalbicans]